jgi:ABC-2 type transport system ATP-binding protein
MSVIDIFGLKKSFGKFEALKGIDLKVEKGEVYGFIGPNGAGKSTSIRCLLGIYKASGGSASIFGKDSWSNSVEIHKDIAYVPGDVNLWGNLSGGEIIDLFIRMKEGKNLKYKDELIEAFELDPTKKANTYSKGNRQKVALVAAFASDADLYILDEPTSGLDPLMEQVFQECVAKVKAAGKTVFLSSHILSEVEKLCDRISIIRQGEIADTGTLSDLRHLSRNSVIVKAKDKLDGIKDLKGVYGLSEHHGETVFQIDNDHTAEIMNFLASKGIEHISVTPPTLEELFMSHYGDQLPVE